MKAQIAKNEARIDGHDTQIKALFRDVDKLDTEVREISKSVIRMTTFVGLATPLLTALIVHFMTT
jgi:septal ring factor EnvC (AmiA/AmiB activator)